MPESQEKRYWDSSVFLAYIKGESGRAPTCEHIIGDARDGKCAIYTSAITLVEVTKERKGPVAVGQEVEATITKFFQNDYIKLIPVDHLIATRARRLIWDFPFLKPRDAIHLAAALHVPVDAIEHYDNDFSKVARQVAGQPGQVFPPIREPTWTGQPDLFEAQAPGPSPPQRIDL